MCRRVRDEQRTDATAVTGLGYSRRTFLQASAAASSASLFAAGLGAWPAHASAGVSERIDFYKVVFDREHPAAVAFGGATAKAGCAVQAIGRDVTALWYDDLYHRWRQGPVAIAGMTPVRVAYCLRVLAQDVGLRVVFRAEHAATGDGRLAHRLSGPRSVLDRGVLLNQGADWPLGAAQLVTGCRADFSAQSTAALISTSASGFAYREPLVSWVIAPPSRA
jgi:hypothetical protein